MTTDTKTRTDLMAELMEQDELQVVTEPKNAIVTTFKDDDKYTREEREKALAAINGLNLSDTNQIIMYGTDVQSKIADFSDVALEKVRNKDLGEIGDSLTDLMAQLKGFSPVEEEKKGLGKLFHKAANPIEELKTKYTKVDANVDRVVDVLEGHQVNLTRDVSVMEELYKANKENFRRLSLYIETGKQKLENERNFTLAKLRQTAELTGKTEDAQAYNDYEQLLTRFEKKIYDLELTREVSLQMAPQIRLLQNNDSLMIEKIQTAIVNTIPLWKSQMVLALGLKHSEDAMKAQRAVNDMTNELLRKNAELLHQTTVGIAQESERGIVDIETLVHTNESLINTIDEVMQIQSEGRQKRREAEAQLGEMEEQLKQKLIETQRIRY